MVVIVWELDLQLPVQSVPSYSWRGVLCDKVCQQLSPGTPVSSTNKTDRHDKTEILLKVALNTIIHFLVIDFCQLTIGYIFVYILSINYFKVYLFI